MNPTDLTELRELVSRATPAPWSTEHMDRSYEEAVRTIEAGDSVVVQQLGCTCCDYGLEVKYADADLIVAAVNALPELLDAAESLERVKALHCAECPAGDLIDAMKDEAPDSAATPTSDPIPILCPECRHDIDDAQADPSWGDQCIQCSCTLSPSEIARALLSAEPTEAEVEVGAREIWRWFVGDSLDGFYRRAYDYDRRKCMDAARAALQAARGLS